MYAVGHAIQAGVNQEVFTGCDTPSRFDRIDGPGLTDAALSYRVLPDDAASKKWIAETWESSIKGRVLYELNSIWRPEGGLFFTPEFACA